MATIKELKNIEEIRKKDYTVYNHVLRRLFCRLADVHEIWPYKFLYYDIVGEFLVDLFQNENKYSYAFKDCGDLFEVSVTGGPYKRTIQIPYYVLEDNWKHHLRVHRVMHEIEDKKSQITLIRQTIKNGPQSIERIQNEIMCLENELTLLQV